MVDGNYDHPGEMWHPGTSNLKAAANKHFETTRKVGVVVVHSNNTLSLFLVSLSWPSVFEFQTIHR